MACIKSEHRFAWPHIDADDACAGRRRWKPQRRQHVNGARGVASVCAMGTGAALLRRVASLCARQGNGRGVIATRDDRRGAVSSPRH